MKSCDTHTELVASLWRIGFFTLALIVLLGMWVG